MAQNISTSPGAGRTTEELLPFIYVKVFLRDKDGKEDYFTTPIRLSEEDAYNYYVGQWWNRGIEDDYFMLCYKIEILHPEKPVTVKNQNNKQYGKTQ